MVRRRAREGDELALVEDRRIDEYVLQVLAAAVGIVIDVEVAFTQRVHRMHGGASTEDLRHRPELHGYQLGLGDDVALPIEQRGRRVLSLAHDVGVGGSHQLGAHLARGGDQALADHGVIDRIELHRLGGLFAWRGLAFWITFSCMVSPSVAEPYCRSCRVTPPNRQAPAA